MTFNQFIKLRGHNCIVCGSKIIDLGGSLIGCSYKCSRIFVSYKVDLFKKTVSNIKIRSEAFQFKKYKLEINYNKEDYTVIDSSKDIYLLECSKPIPTIATKTDLLRVLKKAEVLHNLI